MFLSVRNWSILVQNEVGHRSGVFTGETQQLVNVNEMFIAIRKE